MASRRSRLQIKPNIGGKVTASKPTTSKTIEQAVETPTDNKNEDATTRKLESNNDSQGQPTEVENNETPTLNHVRLRRFGKTNFTALKAKPETEKSETSAAGSATANTNQSSSKPDNEVPDSALSETVKPSPATPETNKTNVVTRRSRFPKAKPNIDVPKRRPRYILLSVLYKSKNVLCILMGGLETFSIPEYCTVYISNA